MPHASSSLPALAALSSSSIESLRSETFMPHDRSSWMTDLRVMPGRMLPSSSGVTISPSILKKTFIEPTSSTYLRSTASSHSTWE